MIIGLFLIWWYIGFNMGLYAINSGDESLDGFWEIATLLVISLLGPFTSLVT
jgi:hypothetical protein